MQYVFCNLTNCETHIECANAKSYCGYRPMKRTISFQLAVNFSLIIDVLLHKLDYFISSTCSIGKKVSL
jgi:hypothetical protein